MLPINRNIVTLDEFTINQVRSFAHATGELSALLRDLALAAKRVHVEVNKAGLVDILGSVNKINVQGEEVKKLDVYANTQFVGVLQRGVSCAGIASEELESFLPFNDPISMQSKYVTLLDPLDGSSNIDVNVSIGTIFSILRRKSPLGTPCVLEDFLQKGTEQVAAGYILYGASTMFVYATYKGGVNGFTLDQTIGEFCISNTRMKCPEDGCIYSVNGGYYSQYPIGVQQYMNSCQRREEEHKMAYSQRYIGSMVADLHRNLIKGGIFLYPSIQKQPQGKLRLLYECNPFAFILSIAGGLASNGEKNILDIVPTHLHQRSPLFIGSKNMVKDLLSHFSDGANSDVK